MSVIDGTISPAFRADSRKSYPAPASNFELHLFESDKYRLKTFDRTFFVVASGILAGVVLRSTRKSKRMRFWATLLTGRRSSASKRKDNFMVTDCEPRNIRKTSGDD